MSHARPFNSYGQIIEEGGGIFASILLARGESYEQIATKLGERYSGITKQATSQVIFGARAAVGFGEKYTPELRAALERRAAEALEGIPHEVSTRARNPLPLGEIPIEPELFGDTPEGRRISMTVEAENEDTGNRLRMDLELAGDESEDDILDEVTAWINRIESDYPDSFKDQSWGDIYATAVKVVQASRKF